MQSLKGVCLVSIHQKISFLWGNIDFFVIGLIVGLTMSNLINRLIINKIKGNEIE